MACSTAATGGEGVQRLVGGKNVPLVVRKDLGQKRGMAASAGGNAKRKGMSCYNPEMPNVKLSHGQTATAVLVSSVGSSSSDPIAGKEDDDRQALSRAPADRSCTAFSLPNITSLERLFSETIWHDLVDSLTMDTLQRRDRLNWLSRFGVRSSLLVPLHTSGDGNCLLHAASLAMWGHHDRFHALRRAVRLTLEGKPLGDELEQLCLIQPSSRDRGMTEHEAAKEAKAAAASIHRRWLWQANSHNMESCGGFSLTAEQWADEWKGILESCSSRDNSHQSGTSPVYHPLEEVHIFALSQVLRRPIVVIADKHVYGASSGPLSPIYFSGIYLPVLVPSHMCHTTPVLLTYLNSHFCGLVAMDTAHLSSVWRAPQQLSRTDSLCAASIANVHQVVPLEMPSGEMLELQFSYDPGHGFCPSQQYGTHKMTRDLWNSFRKSEQRTAKQELLCSYMQVAMVATPVMVTTIEEDDPDGDTLADSLQQQDRYFPAKDRTGKRLIISAELGPSGHPPSYLEYVSNYLDAKVHELSSAAYDSVSELDKRTFSFVLHVFKNYLMAPHPGIAVTPVTQPLSPKSGTLSSSPASQSSMSTAPSQSHSFTPQSVSSLTSKTTPPVVKPLSPRNNGDAVPTPPQAVAINTPSHVLLPPNSPAMSPALPRKHIDKFSTSSDVFITSPKLTVDISHHQATNVRSRPVPPPSRPPAAKPRDEPARKLSQQPSWDQFEEASSAARLQPAPMSSPQPAPRAPARADHAPPTPTIQVKRRAVSKHSFESSPKPVRPSFQRSGPVATVTVLNSSVHQQPSSPSAVPSTSEVPRRSHTQASASPHDRSAHTYHSLDDSASLMATAASPTDACTYVSMASVESTLTTTTANAGYEPVTVPVRRHAAPSPSVPRSVGSPSQPTNKPTPHRPRSESCPVTPVFRLQGTGTAPIASSRSTKLAVSSVSRHTAQPVSRPQLGDLPITDRMRDMILRNRVRYGESTTGTDSGGPSPFRSADRSRSEDARLTADETSPRSTGTASPVALARRTVDSYLSPYAIAEVPPNTPESTPTRPYNSAPRPVVAPKKPPPANDRCSSCGNPRSVRTMTCSECFQHWQRHAR